MPYPCGGVPHELDMPGEVEYLLQDRKRSLDQSRQPEQDGQGGEQDEDGMNKIGNGLRRRECEPGEPPAQGQ